jgi:hypothetical protein
MERVAFLIERTGVRISCLLNPESMVVRREAGLRRRTGAGGAVTGLGRSDDPLVATGGGVTELDLDLLFDVDIARETTLATPSDAETPEMDVRELTRPIWNLAENGADAGQDAGAARYGAPPLVRLIWGRSWNVLGVVVAVAERLERMLPSGMPQRSWLRLRLRRVAETAMASTGAPPLPAATPLFEAPSPSDPAANGGDFIAVPADADGLPRLRLEQIAAQKLGNPALWRSIAAFNDIDDPLNLEAGTVIRLPAAAGAA